MELTPDNARAVRMRSLLLDPSVPRPETVAGVVSWFGAMQSQEIGSGLWSLGARLPGVTTAEVCAALERSEAIRTWPMRGTVHFIPPSDARWMLDLMAVRVLPTLNRVREAAGIGAAESKRALTVLHDALAGRRLTRAETLAALTAAGIETTGQRGYHLLVFAAIHGVVCLAPPVGTQQTFGLLDEWAPEPATASNGAAVMAQRFFRSHGPATEKDFAGWTGLTLTDARRGMAAADLEPVSVGGVPMFLPSGTPTDGGDDTIVVLPGFDEYLLGYKDRSLMAAPGQLAAIVPGGNGVFQPTVVRAGRVIATWKRSGSSKKAVVTVEPFGRVPRARVEAAFVPYQAYLDRPLEITWAMS